jgi:hypothetical protein
MNLYWVTTENHAEDWFIIADSAEEAATFHEDAEGYDPGDATAEMILQISPEISADTGWPSEEILRSCGAEFLSVKTPRIVDIDNRRFCEGLMESTISTLDDNMLEGYG